MTRLIASTAQRRVCQILCVLLTAAVAACGSGDKASPKASVAKIDGSASVGGKPAKIVGCSVEMLPEPPRAATVFTLDNGLRFRDDVYAGPRIAQGSGEWERPDCDRIMTHTVDGDGWTTGEIGFTCKFSGGALVVDAKFDCGVADRPKGASNRLD